MATPIVKDQFEILVTEGVQFHFAVTADPKCDAVLRDRQYAINPCVSTLLLCIDCRLIASQFVVYCYHTSTFLCITCEFSFACHCALQML